MAARCLEVLLADSTGRAMESAGAVRIWDEEELKEADSTELVGSEEAARVPVRDLEKVAQEFEADFSKIDLKIHRFPASLRVLGSRYIAPIAVAIGPYHHGSRHLQEMEKVKLVAAYHFARDSGHSPEDIYEAVVPVAHDVRSLYADDAVSGMGCDDFAAMMFHDACFLLQYMLMCTARDKLDPSLLCCFNCNLACINNDIMLLENQLPWLVIKTLMKFKPMPFVEFITRMGDTFQINRDIERKPFVLDGSYRPPHLLGLLRFYKTGSNTSGVVPTADRLRSISTSISVVELAEIGIKATANNTGEFMDMGIKKGPLLGKLVLAPLFLDVIRASWLVNMVALEVCTASSFWVDDKRTIVCSYLALLAMLMDRKEDVHELRSKHLVQGELSNKETLEFFKSLTKHMYGGPLYGCIMAEIKTYKVKRWMWIKVHGFAYNNFKIIITVLSVIGVLVGIFKTLLFIKQHGQ